MWHLPPLDAPTGVHSPKTAVATLATTPHLLTPSPAPALSVAEEILMAPLTTAAMTSTFSAAQPSRNFLISADVADVDGVKLPQLAASAAREGAQGDRGCGVGRGASVRIRGVGRAERG